MSEFFEKASPESLGIPSDAICRFIKRLEEQKIPMHSFILMRHGKIACETYYAPFDKDTKHRMFSVTKSFVSLAIGLLEAEGKLSLDDCIVDYFQDKLPKNGAHPMMAKTTIRDMLKMASPHDKTTYKVMDIDDWVKTFFHVTPSHVPGTCFNYDTSSTHTLAALAEKLSGMKLLDYLRSRVLNEIGFSEDAYALTDPVGVTMGGSGLVCTPRDLVKVMKLIADGGVYNGKQLLPKEYLAQAISKQIATDAKAGTCEENFGYGYQFWRTRNEGYCCYGMGGQYAVYVPDKDVLYVTTADTQGIKGGNQCIHDAFWTEIYDSIANEPLPEAGEKTASQLSELLGSRRLSCVVRGAKQPEELAGKVSSNVYKMHGSEKQPQLTSASISFDKDVARTELIINDKSYVLEAGIGYNRLQKFPEYNYNTAVSGEWVDDKSFLIYAQIIDECLGNVMIQFSFAEDMVTVMLKHNVEYIFGEFDGCYYGEV